MRRLAVLIATIVAAASMMTLAAPAAYACQGPDGEPCPGARECQSINALSYKLIKQELLACPT